MSAPLLLFDGRCGICRTWVGYWQALTAGSVDFRPFQDAAEIPGLAEKDLARAIFLIEADGRIRSGAGATFRLLAYAPGHGSWWWFYEHVPGFAPLSEAAYFFFARRRGLLAALTRLLWGKVLEPGRMELVSFVFLRLFGLILFSAFASLGVQILGLVGHAGLLPLATYLTHAHHAWGAAAYWRMPCLFWFNSNDPALEAACLLGALCGLLVFAGIFTRAALVLAFLLYLSLVYAGQIFTNYQWDQLLLEVDFLAIFLTAGSPLVVFLFRFLAFRFLFLAGATKLLSGDHSWRALTALDTHFFTQPLPAPLARPASELPSVWLHAGTAATLFVELVLVFCIFLPRRPRMLAALGVVVFQLLIIATGNYNFFNLLTILLCIFLLNDQAIRWLLPRRLVEFVQRRAPRPGRVAMLIAVVLAALTVPVGLDRFWQAFAHRHLPVVGMLTEAMTPWLIVNPYGLFITTTTTRPEIIIQGSQDGRSWRNYVFRYYPGPLRRPLSWNIPHQPRLDWQMWFAAYSNAAENPWFVALLQALLEGRAPVLALLGPNPFPDHPPRYVQAALFDYRFADPAVAARTGEWWVSRPAGLYFPQVSLSDLRRMSATPTP